jgi:hypothetical protein
MYRKEFNIELIIVLDGLTPKYFTEEKIIEKSHNIWYNLLHYKESDSEF